MKANSSKNIKFPIGFWNYVDCGKLDPAEEVKMWNELGMTLAMSFESRGEEDKEDIIKTLDECHKYGIRLIICDRRANWKNYAEKGEKQFREEVGKAAEEFSSHPAFYAFHVGDEPDEKSWSDMENSVRIVNSLSVAFVNFYPFWKEEDFKDKVGVPYTEYGDLLEKTGKQSGLNVLAYDCYNQCYEYERENGLESYFSNLNVFRETAEKLGIPMWTSLLSVGHWCYRVPSEDDFRWQLSTAAAHGAKGFLWFFIYERTMDSSYRLSPIDLYDRRTETFERLARQNKIFRDYFSSRLINASLTRVFHYGKSYGGTKIYENGSIEGFEISTLHGNGLIISEFADEEGGFLAIVNNSQTGSERIRGKKGDKSFDEWLAPGQTFFL